MVKLTFLILLAFNLGCSNMGKKQILVNGINIYSYEDFCNYTDNLDELTDEVTNNYNLWLKFHKFLIIELANVENDSTNFDAFDEWSEANVDNFFIRGDYITPNTLHLIQQKMHQSFPNGYLYLSGEGCPKNLDGFEALISPTGIFVCWRKQSSSDCLKQLRTLTEKWYESNK